MHVNNNHHHYGHATRSYCPLDSVSRVVHTLIHTQAEETRISEDVLLNNTAQRRMTMASSMSSIVSMYQALGYILYKYYLFHLHDVLAICQIITIYQKEERCRRGSKLLQVPT